MNDLDSWPIQVAGGRTEVGRKGQEACDLGVVGSDLTVSLGAQHPRRHASLELSRTCSCESVSELLVCARLSLSGCDAGER